MVFRIASFLSTIHSWIAISILCWWLLLSSPSSTDKFQEFLQRHSFATLNGSRKWVVATLANEAYIPLVNLFVGRLSTLQLENLIVFCIDPYIYEYCVFHHIPAWKVTDLIPPSCLPFSFWQNIFQNINHRRAYPAGGNIEFISLTQLKYLVFYSVISYNVDILFSDPDVVWIQNPIPYLQQKRSLHVDIFIQTDRKYSHQSLFSYMNTGFVYIHSHCATQLLLRIMMQQMYQQYPIISQQRSFNRVLCRTGPFWYSKRVATNTCLTFLKPDPTFSYCIGLNTRLNENHNIVAQIDTSIGP
ncbi:hypothetical protein Gasu2_35570 [Galdieria sulphuraria]|nr:hypothetical protein Gasu2_35570 [Galdieria sulphuraria]